ALAHFQRGAALIYSDRSREGVDDVKMSLRLEPRGSNLAQRLSHVAIGLYFARDYDAAAEAAKNLTRSFPDYPPSYRVLAAACGQLDRIGEAKEALAKSVTLAPAGFELFVRARVPWYRPEDYVHLLEGLRKAGWRET